MPQARSEAATRNPPAVLINAIPIQTREASLGDVVVESRTVPMVWSTGAKVKRYDWYRERYYWETLSLEEGHVRLDRLNNGAPLLASHNSWSLASVFGVIESAYLEQNEGKGSARFSEREEVEPYFKDVINRILRHLSVGYVVHAFEMIPPASEGDLWTYRAIDWEPMEVSLVSIPADSGSSIRSENSQQQEQQRLFDCKFFTRSAAAEVNPQGAIMPTPNDASRSAAAAPAAAGADATQNPTVAPATVDTESIRQAAIAEERTRCTEIRTAVRNAGFEANYADELIASGASLNACREAIINKMADKANANNIRTAANIQTVRDETDVVRAAMGDAIALRADPRSIIVQRPEQADAARQFRGMNLVDMARHCIERSGGRTTGLSRREIAVISLGLDADLCSRAGMHSTSDFPAILGNTVNRVLRAAYQQEQRTFTAWCRQSILPDFREAARAQLSESPKFQQIKEGGEYKVLAFGDSAEKYSLAKSGGIVPVTWETLINDDLDAFNRLPMALAAEAAATESDIVYGILMNNPKMNDNKALFHVDHGNLAAAGAGIDVPTLTAGRAAIRKQTGLRGRKLNLAPEVLLVGPDLEGDANKYTSSQFVAAKSVDVNPEFNRSLEVVVEQRIEGNPWFLTCRPGRIDTIEYAYLEGEEGLYTEQRSGFYVDGLEVKARHCFGAKAIDWRGFWKNPGAAG